MPVPHLNDLVQAFRWGQPRKARATSLREGTLALARQDNVDVGNKGKRKCSLNCNLLTACSPRRDTETRSVTFLEELAAAPGPRAAYLGRSWPLGVLKAWLPNAFETCATPHPHKLRRIPSVPPDNPAQLLLPAAPVP